MAKSMVRLAAGAIVASAIGFGLPAHATTTPADCIAQGDVWVHVEYDETVSGGCATEHATLDEATRSAGIELGGDGGFYTLVDGRTADSTNATEWWSVWTATDGADWTLSQVGANELEVADASVAAWVLSPDWNKEAEPPANNPLEAAIAPAPGDAEGATEDDAADETATAETATDETATDEDASEASDLPVGTIVGVGAVAVLAIGGIVIATRRRRG